MSAGFPANGDGNVENISIYHGKKAKKPESYVEKIVVITQYWSSNHFHHQ